MTNEASPLGHQYIVTYDFNGVVTGFVTYWQTLKYDILVNDVGSFELTLDVNDSKIPLFVYDTVIEIYRSIPGLNVAAAKESAFLVLYTGFEISSEGKEFFIVTGHCLNDFLQRTVIGYTAGTVRAYKDAPSETCMKEYVEENCGAGATLAWNRESDGVIPNFTVATDLARGPEWENEKDFQILLDVLKEIAEKCYMDFIVTNTDVHFVFDVRYPQYGSNRSDSNVNVITGLNSYGNLPVVFSTANNTVSTMKFFADHTSEANVVMVMGDGDGATRTIVTRENSFARNLSPWSRREVARAQSGYQSQMENFGDATLQELKFKQLHEFKVLQQAWCAYGKHYFLGDIVVVKYKQYKANYKIVRVSIETATSGEKVDIEVKAA